MAATDKSIYEKFIIESADQSRTVDISAGVIAFTYFENIFSPYLTARVIVTNTGGSIKGKDGKLQSIYNGLPLRGGERVLIKIASNSNNNIGLDFSKKPTDYFYVASVTNVLIDEGSETFTLNLVSREAITNETVRVGKKFPTSQKISDSVKDILKNYLKVDKIDNIEETQNPYGFIGNMKKPFTILTWLASKSVSGQSKSSEDSSAGYVFYETKKGFSFKSIDSLMEQKPYKKTFRFTPGVISSNDSKKDFKILRYNIDRNQDLIGKLERGAYSSYRYYINPVSFKPIISVFKSDDYIGKTSNLGDKKVSLPKIDKNSDKTLGDLPSRIFVGMLDVGTVEKDASNKGWNNSIERNADPAKIHAQSMMRYNQIFTQVVEIQIPLNTNLNAGSVVRCEFPQLATTKRKETDPETSGLYMIKELAHYFDGKGSYSKLKLVRDTYGRK
tara:strand:- start:2489 stop:3823 length:1335 start_codon:yes stop_codon:yes gene_type:complete